MRVSLTISISNSNPPYEIKDSFVIPESQTVDSVGTFVFDKIKDIGSRGLVILISPEKYKYIPPTRIREIEFEITKD